MSTRPPSPPSPPEGSAGPEAVIVGEVIKAHGIRGEVVAVSFSENPDRFARGAHLLVGSAGSGPAAAVDRVVSRSRSQPPGRVILGFEGIPDRNQAEALRGARLYALPEDLPALPDGSYWERDLLGLEVHDRQGRRLGAISGVLSRFEQDLWQVRTPDAEVFLPAAKEIVISVDLAGGRVVVDPPVGLFGGD